MVSCEQTFSLKLQLITPEIAYNLKREDIRICFVAILKLKFSAARFLAWEDWGDLHGFGFKIPTGGSVPVLL